MAGSITVTRTALTEPTDTGRLRITGEKVSIAWTSDASGNVNGTSVPLYGFCAKVVTVPTDGPTDNYDISVYEPGATSLDAFGGALNNRDTSNSELVYPIITGAATGVYLNGSHEFIVANAGNTKSGTAIFYMIGA